MHHDVSVVVPAFNAERHLPGCLDALIAQDYPGDRLQIVVVDNGSTDKTRSIIEGYEVTPVEEPKRGSYRARNAGVAVARGDLIAFTDADCVVAPDWVRELDRAFTEQPLADAMMGYTGAANAGFWADLEQRNFEAFWYRPGEHGPVLRRNGIDTRNCALRADALAELGGFDPEVGFCGDLELSTRLRAGGRTIGFNAAMRARHHNRTELDPILRIKRDHARAFVRIAASQPQGLASSDLPCDFSRFLGIDNRTVHGLGLRCAQLGLFALSGTLQLSLRTLSRVESRPDPLAVRLFKTACGIEWERVILEHRRNEVR